MTIGPAHGPFWALLIVVALVAADWLLGILAALRTSTFDVTALPRQLMSTVLPYVGAATIVWAIQWLTANYAASGSPAAAVATLFSYFADGTLVPMTLAAIAAKLAVISGNPPAVATWRARQAIRRQPALASVAWPAPIFSTPASTTHVATAPPPTPTPSAEPGQPAGDPGDEQPDADVGPY